MDVVLSSAQEWVEGLLSRTPVLAVGLLLFALFYLGGVVVRWTVRRALGRHDPVLRQMVGQLAFVAVVAIGALFGLSVAFPGVNVSDVLASLGVTGLILGFALKDLLENFAAGLLLLWRRPFTVGDRIRSGDHEGVVQEINFRSTVLRTYDGVKVFVPNGQVFTKPVANLTGYRARRSTVTLGIDQGASIAQAREVILRELRGVEGVLAEPAPAVLFEGIGDFTNDLAVLYWIGEPSRFEERGIRSAVTERLYDALRRAGIGFPYPIRTLQLAEPVRVRSDGAGEEAA